MTPKAGIYVWVPCALNPGPSGEFLVRILSNRDDESDWVGFVASRFIRLEAGNRGKIAIRVSRVLNGETVTAIVPGEPLGERVFTARAQASWEPAIAV